jgi:hypothetical protein
MRSCLVWSPSSSEELKRNALMAKVFSGSPELTGFSCSRGVLRERSYERLERWSWPRVNRRQRSTTEDTEVHGEGA